MAIWSQVLPQMVRGLISDFGSNQTYDDFFLQKTIVTSAVLVNVQFPFLFNLPTNSAYTYDMDNLDISPDPVQNFDMVFIGLVILKAGCMLNLNSYQASINNTVRVRDGDSQVDTTERPKAYQQLLETGCCSQYNSMLKQQSGFFTSMLGKNVTAGGISHGNLLISASYGTIFGQLCGGPSFGGGVY